MRTLIKILILTSGLHSAKSQDELVPNNYKIVVDTNVSCTLLIDQRFGMDDVGPAPICFVRLTNSANSILQGLRLSAEQLFAIHLVDAKGQRVEKTEYGKQFGLPLTQKEIRDWFRPKRRSWAWFYIPLNPSDTWHHMDVRWFSVPKAFKLNTAGEYILYVRMRLIQTGVSDAAGTIRSNIFDFPYPAPKTESISFQSVWLPEVTAKIQIRPEDIVVTNAVSDTKTNYPTR